MNEKLLKKKSKFMSLILRHRPDMINLTLDNAGWADINSLVKLSDLTRLEIEEVVKINDKQRFIISDDNKRIRANQGHSVDVDLQLEPQNPPPFLYHGTASKFLDGIWKKGLLKLKHNHVHLSADVDTAFRVAIRHGSPILFRVDTRQMVDDGYLFYISENGVWLTDNVPTKYLEQDNFK